jgi:hypothetical protein
MSIVKAVGSYVRFAARFCLLRTKFAVSTATLFGTFATAAYAQEAEGAAAGGGGKSWAIPWLIVFLALALGIFITLRPAGRETEIKRDPRMEL